MHSKYFYCQILKACVGCATMYFKALRSFIFLRIKIKNICQTVIWYYHNLISFVFESTFVQHTCMIMILLTHYSFLEFKSSVMHFLRIELNDYKNDQKWVMQDFTVFWSANVLHKFRLRCDKQKLVSFFPFFLSLFASRTTSACFGTLII